MFMTLSGLCAGAFAMVCAATVTPVANSERPAEFVAVERDLDIISKMQEIADGYTRLCQRNVFEACGNLQVLARLRQDLYATSQRCAQAEPRDCDLYAMHRATLLAGYDAFRADAANRERILSGPTPVELRLQEQLEAQRQRDEAFRRRMEELERAQTQILSTISD